MEQTPRINRKQRHLGRELALRWLFQIDVGKLPPGDVLAEIPPEIEGVEEESVSFGQALVRGALEHKKEIDAAIYKYARGWTLHRMAAIDRNVLRIALLEILYMPDIPAGVTVDEAVEIAKSYSTEDSGKFVNGILGAYLRGEMKDEK